jgi:Na+-transporting NADH:ubiquinone oxidoreductase subunit NqrB
MRLKELFSIRYAAPVLISIILIMGHLSFGILEDYKAIFLAIGLSVVTELLLSRLILGKWRNIASAYISGISVLILIRSHLLWPFALAAVISIMSKYVLRYGGRHIWNPSNFGISWLLFFVPTGVAGLSIQWGNDLAPMLIIWTLGIFTLIRAKRLHITITYVISFVFFAYLRSLIGDSAFLAELAPLTGPMYQLFVCFMITDPATTVKSRNGRMLVAFLVALVEFVLRLNEFIYAPFFALFLVGPAAMVISSRLEKRKALPVSA